MKKLFFFGAIALAAAVAFSCKPDDKTEEVKVYRITSFSAWDEDNSWKDTWTYKYDEQGRVADIDRNELDDEGNKNEAKHWVLTYEGQTVKFVRQSDKVAEFELTLGANGFCEKMLINGKSTPRFYTYDATGRITEIKEGEDVASKITLQDNCIKVWTNEWEDPVRKKNHVYTSTKNLGDIHNIYSEVADPARWMYETGLFGHGTAYLAESNQWEDREIGSTLTYDLDANGYVTKETKVYDGWHEYWGYTWEEVKK